jgi:hypothetical protein
MIKFLRDYKEAILSITFLVGTVSASLGTFFYKFNGELSGTHSNWGDFGSFISGTIGVVAACLAVIWLIISVNLQKIELARLKAELKQSANEQKKQTHISALTALVNSSQQAISGHHNDLVARKNGVELESMATEADIRMGINSELLKLKFYEDQIKLYIKEQYIDPYVKKTTEGELEPPF